MQVCVLHSSDGMKQQQFVLRLTYQSEWQTSGVAEIAVAVAQQPSA